jgi:hypothetical protein
MSVFVICYWTISTSHRCPYQSPRSHACSSVVVGTEASLTHSSRSSASLACSSQTPMTHTVKGSWLTRGACAWGQERHLTTGKLGLGRTRLVTMPGWNPEGTTRLVGKGSCARKLRRDLFFALLDAP